MTGADGREPDTGAAWCCSLVLAHRHPVVEVGLRQMLDASRFRLHSRVATLVELKSALQTGIPDLVLADLAIEGGTFSELITLCRRLGAGLVLFSHDMHAGLLAIAQREGVAGWISKTASATELHRALEVVRQGGRCWPAQVQRQLGGARIAPALAERREFPLTLRELEVLRLIASGHSNQRIADQLRIKFQTAKGHVRNILEKLRVHSRTEAAIMARRQGVI